MLLYLLVTIFCLYLAVLVSSAVFIAICLADAVDAVIGYHLRPRRPRRPSPKRWRMTIALLQDIDKLPSNGILDQHMWSAFLELESSDLYSLMRIKHGLHLVPQYIRQEDSYLGERYCQRLSRLFYIRSYTVADALWSGHLYVTSFRERPLIKFRPSDLRQDLVCSVVVSNEKGNVIYTFDRREPRSNPSFMHDGQCPSTVFGRGAGGTGCEHESDRARAA